ncbi:hypothetical protein Tco_0886461 [Tanacetum coccineum]
MGRDTRQLRRVSTGVHLGIRYSRGLARRIPLWIFRRAKSPLDSLKNWNNRFFWVDEKVFPTIVAWRTGAPKDGMPPADFLQLGVDVVDEKVFPTVVAWRTGAPKDGMPPTDSYSALDATTLNIRRTPIQKQPKLLLCLVGLKMDLFNLISAPNPAKGSSGTPSTVEKSPLDFVDEDLPPPNTEGVGTEEQIQDELSREIPPVEHATTAKVVPETGLKEEVATMPPLPHVNKKRKHMRCKRVNDEAEANAPPKVLRKDHVSSPTHNAYGGKSLATMSLGAGSISSTPSTQGAPTAAKSVSDPDPLSSSRGTAIEIPTEHVATTEVNIQLSVGSLESRKSTSVPFIVGLPGGIYQPGWGVTNDCRLDTPDACQDTVDHITPPGYFSELRHLPNADFLSQYNMNLARAKIAKRDQRIQVREEEIKKLDQEVKSLRATETEVHGLRNQTKNLETLLEAEADMKKDAEAKNAELTKELESLRITGEEKIKAAFEEFKKYEDARVEQRCAEMDARLDALSIDFDEELYPHMLTAIVGRRWVIRHGIRLAVMKWMSEGLKYVIEHGKAGRDLVDVEAYDPKANDKLVKALKYLKDLNYPMVDRLERLKDAPMELIVASLHLEGDTGEDAPQRIRDLRQSSSQLNIPMYPETEESEGEASPRLLRSKSLSPMYNLDWP